MLAVAFLYSYLNFQKILVLSRILILQQKFEFFERCPSPTVLCAHCELTGFLK